MKLSALSSWKEKKITKKEISRFKQHIINVLLRNEETLSDGYGYYCEGSVSETLEGIATEIEEVVRMLVLASHRAEVMMDTCALMGIGNWLVGQYRDDWATTHADLIGALELFQEEK